MRIDSTTFRACVATSVAAMAVAAAGCTATITTGDGGSTANFGESATSSILPSGTGRAVLTTLTITNIGVTTQTLTWGVDCGGTGPFELRAYRVVNGARVLAWSSAALPRLVGCPAALVLRTLNPGDAVDLTRTIDVASILGDSLPAGSYVFTARAATTPAIDSEVPAGTLTLTTAVVSGPGVNLDGIWSGESRGVSVTLALRWFADSVVGGGTFTVTGDNTIGCGGGTLRGTGTVTMSAQRTGDQLTGGMAFGNGWTPPFSAVLVDTLTLGGEFHSVDTGACPLTLVRR
ncbi:MAG TPA: hypothetical protein VN651_18350 [Gemmatimonadaceae bacterium]|nr:hypothetical protein [Gemmatimonadaceae bacterium]